MKTVIAIVLSLGSISASAAPWYYRCVGKAIWPHCYVSNNNRTCPEYVTFDDEATMKRASTLRYEYAFMYVGKTDIIDGHRITPVGICEGWSNASPECSYATDFNQKDLLCTAKNVGSYIATKN